MAMITIQSPDESELQSIEGEHLDAYEGWTVVASNAPPRNNAIIENGVWVVPLSVLQDEKWEEVKKLRLEKENGTAPTSLGHDVQIDEPSKAKINGVLSMCKLAEEVGAPFSESFTMADNEVITLDNTSIRQLALAAATYVSQVYAHARDLRTAIYAAADETELDAIDIVDSWP